MKRREVAGAARFITFSCQRRLPLLGTPAARDVLARSLGEARDRFGFALIAWVAMPEHVHLLMLPPAPAPLSTPARSASRGEASTACDPDPSCVAAMLKSFKLSAAQRLLAGLRAAGDPVLDGIRTADGSPRVWQKGGGFDRSVRGEGELIKEIAYIHRNPIERGLVSAPTEWRWSSARWWAARHAGVEQDSGDVPYDLPPGDARRWVKWEGFT